MKKQTARPPQAQKKPGRESAMRPRPETSPKDSCDQSLKGKTVLITGGDSGIGRATALLFASKGADIAIAYLSETSDAKETAAKVKKYGVKCILFRGDLGREVHCRKVAEETVKKMGRLDILINNAGNHWDAKDIADITSSQLRKTFESNFFSVFWLTKYAIPHMKKGSCIINTTSVTAYRGSDHLLDYAATKGAILAFTRSLSSNLVKKGIRVNAVAPGPIWTPLIASTFSKSENAKFGTDVPMGRAGEPSEVAGCFLFLASDAASYITGQVLHPNGGEIING